MNALHKCDNPSCCNPNHLFWGTQKDNMADCAAKGRINPSKGELSGRAILTEKDVIDIRKMASRGMSYAILGKRFGVHKQTIASVVVGKSWKHIPYLS